MFEVMDCSCSWYGPVDGMAHWNIGRRIYSVGYIDDLCAYRNTRSRVYLSKAYSLLNSLAFGWVWMHFCSRNFVILGFTFLTRLQMLDEEISFSCCLWFPWTFADVAFQRVWKEVSIWVSAPTILPINYAIIYSGDFVANSFQLQCQ